MAGTKIGVSMALFDDNFLTVLRNGIQSQADAAGLKVYHELDNTLYSVTSNTFIGSVYSLFGLRNIADNVEAGNDYPQLNAEYIVQQNPALIFLADTKLKDFGSPLARAYEAPGRGFHWGMATFHPTLPRGARVQTVDHPKFEAMVDLLVSRAGQRLAHSRPLGAMARSSTRRSLKWLKRRVATSNSSMPSPEDT